MRSEISILHVDDEPSLRDLTKTFLERNDEQFTVETATSADEGLEVLGDRPPDCIVSDYNMPGMDGLEFLQTVRADHPDLPFILLTGRGSEEVASDAIAADVTDYLQKGTGTEQYELLANRIRNAVQARREAERADRQEELMRLTEFAGDTGGFELDIEANEVVLTDGARRILNVPERASYNHEEGLENYHPDDREKIQQTIQRALQTGEQTQGTWRYQHPDPEEQQLLDITYTPATANGDTTTIRGAIHDITEQQERRQELKTERRFITQVLDSLEDLFYVIDTDGTLRRWNETGLDVTGYSEAELDEMPAIELFPEDEQEKVARGVETTLTDGEAIIEADLLTADGERLPYEFRGARLTDDDGEPTGVVGIGRDLTERREQEQRFQALIEESNDIISVVDANGRYQYQSPSLERILGHVPEETVGDTAWEYIHPDDREAVIEEFETWVANPDQRGEVEYRARDADGSWRWMEAEGNNQLDNPAVEGYVINSREITARKQRQRELQRTSDLMSSMGQLADVGAWEYNQESDTLMLTDGTRRLYGLDPDAGLTLDEALDAVHPDDREQLADRLNACLETGEPYEMDVRLTTTDGEQRWVTARGERVADDESGSVVRGYIRDITEQKQRERRLTELNQATQALLTAETSQEVAEIGVRAARDILGLQANAVHLCDADDTLSPLARTDELVSLLDEVPSLSVADSIAGRVYQRGESTVVEDARQDPDAHNSETDLKGHVYLPLAEHGVLIAGSEEQAAFDQQHLAVGELLAGNLVAALDRLEREQTVSRQQQELSVFFEESPLGVVQWDDEFQFERLNERAQEILGYEEAEVRGEPWETIVVEEDRDYVGEVVEDLLAADGGTHATNRNVRQDGETRICKWHNRAVTDADGSVRTIFSKFEDITEQEQRKQELERARDLLDQTERLADVGGWEIDTETMEVFWTENLFDLLGVDYDEEPSLDEALEVYHEDDRPLVENAVETALDAGESFDVEARVYRPDGELRWLRVQGTPETDDGRVVTLRGTVQDITEQKQMKLDLRQERDLVTGIVETSPVGITVFNADGDLSFANDRAKTIYGRSSEEIKEMSHDDPEWDLVNEHGDQFEAGNAPFDRVFSGETAMRDHVVGVCRPSGERVWLSVSGAPQYNDDGELERVVFAFEDITEQRELEAELSEILGRISDGFFALDEEFRVTHVNDYGEELLETSEDELLGETLWDVHPEIKESDKIWDRFRTAMDTQTTQSLEFRSPGQNWFDVTVYPSESGVSVYFRDVTERKKNEQELKTQNERLEEFASIVSHDLRNPLGVAEGYLELAEDACESEHLQKASDALDRSQALIDDLLTLAREGDQVDETGSVGLGDVARDSWQSVETAQATLETETSQTVKADRSRLRQVFANVYRNAVEHGGESVTIHVGETDGGFYVADTGPGIPESERDDVFEAGYSTAQEGTGFGLRIVKQVADAHGWTITLTESEQGGARFEITGVETPA